MTNRRDELIDLTHQFVDAFNRMSLDDVVAFFAEDGIYEDSTGGTHVGHDAIRTAFEPLVSGSRGKIRFDGEDVFICLLYTSPSPRDATLSRMPSSA